MGFIPRLTFSLTSSLTRESRYNYAACKPEPVKARLMRRVWSLILVMGTGAAMMMMMMREGMSVRRARSQEVPISEAESDEVGEREDGLMM